MRTSMFLAPLFAAGLVVACSSSVQRSGFDTDTNGTNPTDGGKKVNTFQPNGNEGNATDDGGCSQSQTTITRTPVVIEFLLDESSSMSDNGKWDAATQALQAAFDDMHTTADPATFIGMMRFGSMVDHQVKPKIMTSDPDDAQYTALGDALSDTNGGGTETFAGLTAAWKVVDGFKPPAAAGLDTTDMKRIVVIMTDGVPSGGSDEQQQCISGAADQMALTPPAGPVNTFAVGIGPFPTDDPNDYDPTFMGNLAVAGGTAPAGCDPTATDPSAICHFQVTPGGDVDATKQQLLDAIDKIRALSASCDFGFTITGNADLNNINVTITDKDGNVQSIAKDPDNGWTFDDDTHPTKVILHGDACSASNGTVSGRVDVTLGCQSAK